MTGYAIESCVCKPGWMGEWKACDSALTALSIGTTAKVDELLPATQYTFRVFAINANGRSQPSATSSLIRTAESVPLQLEPPQLSAITGVSMVVSWKAVHEGAAGGLPIQQCGLADSVVKPIVCLFNP